MFNFIKKQFIDVIQWPNPDDSLLMWRFPIADEEIQNGASLTVREAQMAMFVDEGVTADVFGPGRYTLNTQTLPLLDPEGAHTYSEALERYREDMQCAVDSIIGL